MVGSTYLNDFCSMVAKQRGLESTFVHLGERWSSQLVWVGKLCIFRLLAKYASSIAKANKSIEALRAEKSVVVQTFLISYFQRSFCYQWCNWTELLHWHSIFIQKSRVPTTSYSKIPPTQKQFLRVCQYSRAIFSVVEIF